MKNFEYRFNYSNEEYDKIINSNILNLFNDERVIFELLHAGVSGKEIAKQCNISYRTLCRRKQDVWWKIYHLLNDTDNQNLVMNKTKHYYSKPNYRVYLLIFPNDKVYIGQSLDPKTRWQNGEGYKDNKEMYSDIKKYGWKNIKKQIVYSNLSYEESIEKEKELIINYRSNIQKFGYNKVL